MSTTETWPAPDLSARHDEKWRREQRAFHDLLPGLLRTNPGQYVAIHDGQVVQRRGPARPSQRDMNERRGRFDLAVVGIPDHPAGPSTRRGEGTRAETGGPAVTRLTKIGT